MENVKIVGGLTEFKEDKKFGKSLLQRIQEAQNEFEVNYLLDLGKSYRKAAPGTMKQWVMTASKKIESFKT